MPDTGFELPSSRVIVILDVLDPLATMLLVPEMVELAAETAVETKVTVVVSLLKPEGVEIESVFAPVTVEEIVPVA